MSDASKQEREEQALDALLVSALRLHGLTARMPPRIWMAIRRSTWTPAVSYPPLRFVYFGDKAFAAGVETRKIERVPVRIYGVTKTVVDCFRYRHKIGVDVALEALREALARGLCSPDDLFKLAQELHTGVDSMHTIDLLLQVGA